MFGENQEHFNNKLRLDVTPTTLIFVSHSHVRTGILRNKTVPRVEYL